jgi:hypothetical protein
MKRIVRPTFHLIEYFSRWHSDLRLFQLQKADPQTNQGGYDADHPQQHLDEGLPNVCGHGSGLRVGYRLRLHPTYANGTHFRVV